MSASALAGRCIRSENERYKVGCFVFVESVLRTEIYDGSSCCECVSASAFAGRCIRSENELYKVRFRVPRSQPLAYT